jgi:hypothetical protein
MGLLLIAEVIMSMENHGEMMPAQEKSCLVHQRSLAILPAEPSGSE